MDYKQRIHDELGKLKGSNLFTISRFSKENVIGCTDDGKRFRR